MSTMVTELAVPLPYGTLRERGSKSRREVRAMPTLKSYYNRDRRIPVFVNLRKSQRLQPCKCQNIKCKVYSQTHLCRKQFGMELF
jgi:hypothetical protein